MSFDPGVSGISGASDVFLSSPTTNDALSYDSGIQKWKNQVVDKARVGLGNVDNTSDVNKPISTATQTALDTKANASSLAPVATSGDYNDLSNKPVIPTPPVTSVNTRTGDIALTKSDVGLANVDNTSDANKPVSTATQTALNGKANTTHTHAQADITNLTSDLAGKASTVHTHAIADVTSLQATLDGKEPAITTLQTTKGGTGLTSFTSGTFLTASSTSALASTKTVPAGTVVGSSDTQTLTNKTISGSSNTISNIAQSSVTNLTSDLAGKANTVHTHTIADTTGLQTAIDSKVNASGVPTLGFANSQAEIPAGAPVGSLWVIP